MSPLERRVALVATNGNVGKTPGRDHYLEIVAAALGVSYREVLVGFSHSDPDTLKLREVAKTHTFLANFGIKRTAGT